MDCTSWNTSFLRRIASIFFPLQISSAARMTIKVKSAPIPCTSHLTVFDSFSITGEVGLRILGAGRSFFVDAAFAMLVAFAELMPERLGCRLWLRKAETTMKRADDCSDFRDKSRAVTLEQDKRRPQRTEIKQSKSQDKDLLVVKVIARPSRTA
jgi:hypothetical protein